MTKLTFGTGCLRCAACAGRMGSIHLTLIFKKKKKKVLWKNFSMCFFSSYFLSSVSSEIVISFKG